MARISLGGGAWFDSAAAESWDEDDWFNGSNRISVATGSQWEHQKLYRTARGRWILHCWSQWQGSRETYEVIPESQAHAWLADNDHADEIPAEVESASEL